MEGEAVLLAGAALASSVAAVRGAWILSGDYAAIVDAVDAGGGRSAWLPAFRHLARAGRRRWLAPLAWQESLAIAACLLPMAAQGVGSQTLLLTIAVLPFVSAGLIDARSGLLPGFLSKAALALGLAAAALGPVFVSLEDSMVAAAGSLVALHAIAWVSEALGRPALGRGDAWLVAAIASWTGIEPLFQILLVALGSAFVSISVAEALQGKGWLPSRTTAVRLGPFLAGGFLLAVSTAG